MQNWRRKTEMVSFKKFQNSFRNCMYKFYICEKRSIEFEQQLIQCFSKVNILNHETKMNNCMSTFNVHIKIRAPGINCIHNEEH